jgi:hypothetical protein
LNVKKGKIGGVNLNKILEEIGEHSLYYEEIKSVSN